MLVTAFKLAFFMEVHLYAMIGQRSNTFRDEERLQSARQAAKSRRARISVPLILHCFKFFILFYALYI